MKKMLLALTTLVGLSQVSAQDYAGTVSDLNTVFDPPQNIQSLMCDHLANQTDRTAYSACVDGVFAASWMAQKHAVKVGNYLGCIDGYYQGVSDGFDMSSNPTSEEIQRARTLYSQLSFETAIARAKAKAELEGDTASSDQLIKRYRDVLNQHDAQGNPILPNKTIQVPVNTFKGFDDGYEKDILPTLMTGSVDDMVGPNASQEDKYIAHRIKAKQAQVAAQLCDLNQTLFLQRRKMPSLSLWDYFKAHRQYNFQNYGWKNGDWAWDFYINEEKTAEQYRTFTKIEGYKKTITEKVEVLKLDANGNPIRKKDPQGNDIVVNGQFVYETEIKLVTKEVPLSPQEIAALKGNYQTGFEEAYSRYYAKQYASREYYLSGSRNYGTAKQIGLAVGSEVAKYRAERDAYNQGYKVQSARVFGEEAEKKFVESFKRLLGVFETNSVYELNDARIEGQINDGIFRGGEAIAASFEVSNLGERVNNSTFSLLSSLTLPQKSTHLFSVPVLTTGSFTTPFLATLTNTLIAGDSISLSLGIENQSSALSVADALVVKKNQKITLHDYAEIKNVSAAINVNEGILEVTVDVTNAAGIKSPSTAEVVMLSNISSGETSTSIMALDAKETRKILLTSTDLDPYSLIINRTVSVVVSTKMAEKTISKKTVEFSPSNLNEQDLIIEYFAALATGVTNNSGNEPRQVRLQNLADIIEKGVAREIERKIKWHKASVVAASSLRSMVDTYLKFVRRGQMNAEGQSEFNELSLSLAKRVVGLKARGMLNNGKARKAYLKELHKISEKVSLNPRDY